MSFPEPPRGEVDADGRHVHPYVRDPEPDSSAPGYVTARGEQVTSEDRSRESRLMFHLMEEMLGHLTPLGLAYLMQAITHRLYTPALGEQLAATGVTAEELDPRGELLAFEEMHQTTLRTIHEAVEIIVATCPNCGRSHQEGCITLQPGGYVHASSGDAVSVRRVADSKVYAVVQVDPNGREVTRVYERDWFEKNFVPAEDVQVLGGPV